MTARHDATAAKELPCHCGMGDKAPAFSHGSACPAYYRPAIAAALEKEAGRMPERDALASLLEKEIPERDIYGEWHPKAFTRFADAIISAWNNPQADSAGEGR